MPAIAFKLKPLIFELKKNNLKGYINSYEFKKFSVVSGYNDIFEAKLKHSEAKVDKSLSAFIDMISEMYKEEPFIFFNYIKKIVFDLYFWSKTKCDFNLLLLKLKELNCTNDVIKSLEELISFTADPIDEIPKFKLSDLDKEIKRLEANLDILDSLNDLKLLFEQIKISPKS